MDSITIKHPSLSPEELQARLLDLKSPDFPLRLELEKREGTRSGIDPNVLVAIISGSVTVLTTLITAMLTIMKEKNNRTLTIQTKEGNRYDIPLGASHSDVDAYISKMENKEIKAITINN